MPLRSRGQNGAVIGAALAAAILALPERASAEFEIQESTIDEGEVQLQYRGAWHEGLPWNDRYFASPDDEEAPLRQSHEAEIQMSITSHWLIAMTHGFEQEAEDSFKLTAIEVETQVELITLEGDGFGLAVQGGIEKPLRGAGDEEAPDFHFGPILELAKGKTLFTFNPLFFRNYGPLAEQEGWGFEYGWQGRYELTPRLALTIESFGEIEDLAKAGAFDEQVHSIGPAFYYTFGEADEEAKKGAEFTISFGAQFGLTDATSDVALKVFIGHEFF